MKTKKIPMRMCIACHEMKPKKEMLRVVKPKETYSSIIRERRPGAARIFATIPNA